MSLCESIQHLLINLASGFSSSPLSCCNIWKSLWIQTLLCWSGLNRSLNIWNAGPHFFLSQNFGSLPVKVTIVSQWKKLEFLNMTWKGHPVASSEICCPMVALKFSSHGFRLSLDFSLNPCQSGDGNVCWLECRVSTDVMDDTLLPSWCFFLSTNHEATDVPAKGHLWVWTQGKDSYRSAPELQRRNLSIVSRLEPTNQSLLSVAHHKLRGHVALSLLLDPRTWQQGTAFALGGGGDRGRMDNFVRYWHFATSCIWN